MWGFQSLKDVLEVVGVPLVVFVLGLWLAGRPDRRRRERFINLIRQELEEAKPEPEGPTQKVLDKFESWTDLLKKRFIHQDIFENPSENRDFILNLDPGLAYSLAQMWGAFRDAKPRDGADHTDYGRRGLQWLDHLRIVCKHLDRRGEGPLYKRAFSRLLNMIRIKIGRPPPHGKLYNDVYGSWSGIISRKYPDVTR